jgi:hypothetical protein
MECTTSIETGRTWRELKDGTDSRIVLPCPHCHAWVTPEREHLVGWQDARDVIEAREKAALVCPSCGAAWTEAGPRRRQRGGQAAAQGPVHPAGRNDHRPAPAHADARVPVHRRQQPAGVDAAGGRGRVVGAAAHRPGLAEKKLRQFYWTLPSEPETVTLSEFDVAALLARTTTSRAGRIPADATRSPSASTSASGCATGWLNAWRPGGTPHVADYGVLEVPSASMAEEVAILSALRKFRDEMCANGWPVARPAGGEAAGRCP